MKYSDFARKQDKDLIIRLKAVRERDVPEDLKHLCADAANRIESTIKMFDSSCMQNQRLLEFLEEIKLVFRKEAIEHIADVALENNKHVERYR